MARERPARAAGARARHTVSKLLHDDGAVRPYGSPGGLPPGGGRHGVFVHGASVGGGRRECDLDSPIRVEHRRAVRGGGHLALVQREQRSALYTRAVGSSRM